MESRLLFISSKAPYKRMLANSAMNLAIISIIVPLFGAGLLRDYLGGAQNWYEAIFFWVFSLLLLLAFGVFGHRVKRASQFYILERFATIPFALVFLDTGLRIIHAYLGLSPLIWILSGLLLGLATLPWRISSYRGKFKNSIKEGHLQKSLDCNSFIWDPQFDNDRWIRDAKATNPGCMTRLLFWIGPAIGMTLADVVGRFSASIFAGLISIIIGYMICGLGIISSIGKMLEFRRMEKELGHPILLVEAE